MFTLVDDQQAVCNVQFVDAKGNPTGAENVTLESSDSSVVAVTDNGDGTFLLVAGTPGTAQLSITADARIGEGERIISGTETINVVAGEAAVLKLTLGEPTPQ